MTVDPAELEDSLIAQIGALAAIARRRRRSFST